MTAQGLTASSTSLIYNSANTAQYFRCITFGMLAHSEEKGPTVVHSDS